MGPVVSIVLLVCAVVLMCIVGSYTSDRGDHTKVSICLAFAAVCLVFASIMALYVFK